MDVPFDSLFHPLWFRCSCAPGLCSIPMFYWWIHNSIPWSLHDRLATSFSKHYYLWLVICIMLTLWVKQQWWNLSKPWSMLRASLLNHRGFLYLSGSCLQMLLAIALHYQVLHSLRTICHSSLAEDLLVDQHPMHLFLGILVLSHCKMPWLHSFWWQFWLFV